MIHQNTTDFISIITSTDADIDIVTDYINQNLGEIKSDYASISSATTTPLSLDEGANCKIESLSIRNKDSVDSCVITIIKTKSSVEYEIFKATLAIGESILYEKGFRVYTSDGKIKLQTTGAVSTGADGISVDNSGWDVITGANVQTAFDSTDTALLNARSTGWRYGGGYTDLTSGVVRIAAGAGQILDNTTPNAPTFTAVTWTQQDIDIGDTDGVKYLYIDNTGTLQTTSSDPSHSEHRLNIYLWRVSIISGEVSGITGIIVPTQQLAPQIWDLFRILGLNKRGFDLSPASTNLTIAVAAGEIYSPGANATTDATNPHEVEIAAKSPATFRLVRQNGSQGSDVTSLDVGNYDNGGTVTAIPGSSTRAQIFTVRMFTGSGGNIRIFYGQNYYDSIEEAQQALFFGTYNPVFPNTYIQNSIVLGWFIVEKGATNLADGTQVYITANKFGLVGGAIASTGGGYLYAANNLSDLENITTAKTNLSLENVDNTSDATKNSATATLTNKRITPRVTSIVSEATPTFNTDNCDAVNITALGTAITNMSTNVTGTPTNFQKLLMRIKDDGTARAISSWGSLFEPKGVALPDTTVAGKVLTLGFLWDTVTSKWGLIGLAQEE